MPRLHFMVILVVMKPDLRVVFHVLSFKLLCYELLWNYKILNANDICKLDTSTCLTTDYTLETAYHIQSCHENDRSL